MACVYDSYWYIGFVEAVNTDEGDITIKFMHPHGPITFCYWPQNDTCEVPFQHILCEVSIHTATGRTYHLTKETNELINFKWQEYLRRSVCK